MAKNKPASPPSFSGDAIVEETAGAELVGIPEPAVVAVATQWAELRVPLGVVPADILSGHQMNDGANLYLNQMTWKQRAALLALERGCQDEGIATNKSAAVRYVLDQIVSALGIE